MSIPTDPQTLAFECKGSAGESLEKTVEDLMAPEITPKPGSPIADALSDDITAPKVLNPSNISGIPSVRNELQKIKSPQKTANRRLRRGGTRRKKNI